MNRRLFVKTSGLALIGTALTPRVFARMAKAGAKPGKILVTIFQRGAVDGLNMIVPYGERAYAAARPSIGVPKSDVLDLDGFFGAHPSLESLMPYWKDRSLAVVHAAGSPDTTRSHFDAQDFMESGTPGVKSTSDGFLSRTLAVEKAKAAPLQAVAISASTPRILAGSQAIVTTDVVRYANSPSTDLFASTYPEAFEAGKILKSMRAENGGGYPRNPLGNALQQIARIIKSDVGLEIAFADVGGWDTHAAQGGKEGQLANNLRGFSDAISAFARDLGSRMSDVVLVTTSEFGRTVRENGNRGTDHGHATVMLALGGNVNGGKVHGKWPGLDRDQLFEGRDLAVTTDFRDVFGEMLTKHLSVSSLAAVFPGFRPGVNHAIMRA